MTAIGLLDYGRRVEQAVNGSASTGLCFIFTHLAIDIADMFCFVASPTIRGPSTAVAPAPSEVEFFLSCSSL